MDKLLYKDHFIIVVARPDEISTFWIPVADISWETDGERESHTITGGLDRFNNWQDAEEHMIKLAKEWIDEKVTNHLRSVYPHKTSNERISQAN
jgi:hypothetical protein